MTLTIAFGWWLAPALITIAAFAWAMQDKYTGGSYNFAGLFTLPFAGCVSLAAWLAWSVLS